MVRKLSEQSRHSQFITVVPVVQLNYTVLIYTLKKQNDNEGNTMVGKE